MKLLVLSWALAVDTHDVFKLTVMQDSDKRVALPGDQLFVHYTARTTDGEVIDSSYATKPY
jgi:FKBP-type peptidyl-prolyl cis-trans isomerase